MQKCPLVQSAFLSGFWTDLRHQYGIFGGESQTSLFPFRSSLRDVNERRLYSQARRDREISVAKTRRDREVISRRDMEISAGSFAARSQWESCRDSRRETKFLAVKIFLLPRREAKFPAAKIGSMRTKFTFTLTINQTTRR